MDWRVDPELVDNRNAEALSTQQRNEMRRFKSSERCFSCEKQFTDSDQIALISTQTGWVCDLPGDLAKYAVWQPGDAEVFHKACWERLGITKAATC